MSHNDAPTEKDQEHRTSQRFLYNHHLDITFENNEWPAQILDWSKNGIQVYVKAPLQDQAEYTVAFQIHRMSFVEDEAYEDDDAVPPVEEWSREGEVRWTKSREEGVAVGIHFKESFEDLPLPDLSDFITEGDLCLLWIFPKNGTLM